MSTKFFSPDGKMVEDPTGNQEAWWNPTPPASNPIQNFFSGAEQGMLCQFRAPQRGEQ